MTKVTTYRKDESGILRLVGTSVATMGGPAALNSPAIQPVISNEVERRISGLLPPPDFNQLPVMLNDKSRVIADLERILAGVESERRDLTASEEQAFKNLVQLGNSLNVQIENLKILKEKSTLSTQPLSSATRYPNTAVTRDHTDYRIASASAALSARADAQKFPLKDGIGREHMSMTLLEVAKECLSARGVDVRGESKSRIAELALTTSDFPLITADVANKSLRQAYDVAPRTFVPFCRKASAPDFKNINRLQLGENPQLEKVGDGGEFKYGSLTESREQYKLVTYGKVVSITRQTIINDDLSAFTRVPAGYGVAAATLESDTVWGIITANAAMADGNALFHTAHKNKNTGAGSALGLAGMGSAMSALAQQKGLDGKTLLSIQGRFVLVPTALQLAISQLIGNVNPTQSSNVVPDYIRMLQPIAEPRLDVSSAAQWYLAASPDQIDTIEYCYLEGEEGVYIDQRMGFQVDGVEMKARLDFGAKAIDFRGLQLNVGS